MFTVYTMNYRDETYVGVTSNLSKRKYVHKARFYQWIDGSDYPVYKTLRKMTKVFDKIEWNVLKTFSDKSKAELYESKMIKKIGTLNTRS